MILSALTPSTPWELNIDEAQQRAQDEQKKVLIYFSGSDWCRPCIQLKSEILESEVFQEYAQEELVMVLADFPKRKKNRLSAEQNLHNEKLAEQYNLQGYFPLLVILDAEGNIKGQMGFESIGPQEYVNRIRSL